jgi:DNA-directed RNA polymerase, beta subunit/140 kD subunit
MYSGVDGSMMQAQIFFGVVHYQRLRHMVSDKWQVMHEIQNIFSSLPLYYPIRVCLHIVDGRRGARHRLKR